MDQEKYNQITSELDAREILRYLNHLGITNISGEILKYFITDLKKLIKYDLEQNILKENNNQFEWSERLYSTSTFSSRLRSQVQSRVPTCTRECKPPKLFCTTRNIKSAPDLYTKVENTLPRRACSCINTAKKPAPSSQENKSQKLSNNNLIKVSIPQPLKKCDPVSLYHYYTSLWEKYKPNMPGENNWADLRWTTRQKMAGCPDNLPVTKKTILTIPEKKKT